MLILSNSGDHAFPASTQVRGVTVQTVVLAVSGSRLLKYQSAAVVTECFTCTAGCRAVELQIAVIYKN